MNRMLHGQQKRAASAGVRPWPCSISIHLSPKSVAAGVRPFPPAMQQFLFIPQAVCRWVGFLNSFLRCVRPFCHCCCPPFSAGHAAFPFIRLPCDFFTFVCQVQCLYCWCPPFSAGRAACLFICHSVDFLFFVSQVRSLHCWCLPFSAGHAAFLSIPQTVYC